MNGAGQHDGLFGISIQLEFVRLNGIISHLQGNLKAIVFTNQVMMMNVQKCISDNRNKNTEITYFYEYLQYFRFLIKRSNSKMNCSSPITRMHDILLIECITFTEVS